MYASHECSYAAHIHYISTPDSRYLDSRYSFIIHNSIQYVTLLHMYFLFAFALYFICMNGSPSYTPAHSWMMGESLGRFTLFKMLLIKL